MKLGDDSLERFRASGLGAAAAVPAVPSILPLPLMEGPDDPAERVEAIRAGIARLAPFEPECVLFLTGPGDDREAVARRHPRDRRRRPRAGRAGRARADPARVRALLVGRQLAGRGRRADRGGRRRRRPAVRHRGTSGASRSSRSSATATGSAASTSPTGASRPATRTTACCPATASSSSAPILDALALGRLLRPGDLLGRRAARARSGGTTRASSRARGLEALRRTVSTASA